jgi:large subunit ribosomal protein L15
MKENEIPAGANRSKSCIGRGEGNGHGKTSGRGHKGAGARRVTPCVQDLKVVKCLFSESYRNEVSSGLDFKRFATVNLYELEKLTGDKVDIDSLKEAGLIRSKLHRLRFLGTGEISKAFTVSVDQISKSAKKIEAAGGTISK